LEDIDARCELTQSSELPICRSAERQERKPVNSCSITAIIII